jgi:hypothetical protein
MGGAGGSPGSGGAGGNGGSLSIEVQGSNTLRVDPADVRGGAAGRYGMSGPGGIPGSGGYGGERGGGVVCEPTNQIRSPGGSDLPASSADVSPASLRGRDGIVAAPPRSVFDPAVRCRSIASDEAAYLSGRRYLNLLLAEGLSSIVGTDQERYDTIYASLDAAVVRTPNDPAWKGVAGTVLWRHQFPRRVPPRVAAQCQPGTVPEQLPYSEDLHCCEAPHAECLRDFQTLYHAEKYPGPVFTRCEEGGCLVNGGRYYSGQANSALFQGFTDTIAAISIRIRSDQLPDYLYDKPNSVNLVLQHYYDDGRPFEEIAVLELTPATLSTIAGYFALTASTMNEIALRPRTNGLFCQANEILALRGEIGDTGNDLTLSFPSIRPSIISS